MLGPQTQQFETICLKGEVQGPSEGTPGLPGSGPYSSRLASPHHCLPQMSSSKGFSSALILIQVTGSFMLGSEHLPVLLILEDSLKRHLKETSLIFYSRGSSIPLCILLWLLTRVAISHTKFWVFWEMGNVLLIFTFPDSWQCLSNKKYMFTKGISPNSSQITPWAVIVFELHLLHSYNVPDSLALITTYEIGTILTPLHRWGAKA